MNSIVPLSGLIARLALRENLSEELAKQFITEFFRIIEEQLVERDTVVVTSLGTFAVVNDQPTFTPSEKFAAACNEPFEMFAPMPLPENLDPKNLEAEVEKVKEIKAVEPAPVTHVAEEQTPERQRDDEPVPVVLGETIWEEEPQNGPFETEENVGPDVIEEEINVEETAIAVEVPEPAVEEPEPAVEEPEPAVEVPPMVHVPEPVYAPEPKPQPEPVHESEPQPVEEPEPETKPRPQVAPQTPPPFNPLKYQSVSIEGQSSRPTENLHTHTHHHWHHNDYEERRELPKGRERRGRSCTALWVILAFIVGLLMGAAAGYFLPDLF